ncbi:unnamed protein product [Soboliphyme baturini]|uniref:Aldehyde dehydrogenase n=1 Tax=Soboliphyme baturini TaxID=241478 RepID=A0A183IIQ7_9BILA|nr:unnamed protein product [Soboliphyme baturini]
MSTGEALIRPESRVALIRAAVRRLVGWSVRKRSTVGQIERNGQESASEATKLVIEAMGGELEAEKSRQAGE